MNNQKDPVCGMNVDPKTSKYFFAYKKVKYYFCCEGCLKKFKATPQDILDKKSQANTANIPQNISKNTTYTCPMDPEIEQMGPGSCPICGMALEPMGIPDGEIDTSELDDMKKRFWISLIFSVPILLLVMLSHLPSKPLSQFIPSTTAIWLEFILSLPVIFWCGLPIFKKAWVSVKTGNLNMFTLIGLGTGLAFIYSVVATLVPEIFPMQLRMPSGKVNVYFEAASTIITLVLLGQVMELLARFQTNTAIRDLLDLAPKTARIILADGSQKNIPLSEVQVGNKLSIRPGESIATDGEIIEGHSTIDESMLTGEAKPVSKSSGHKVTGATLNQTGSFIMIAQQVGNDTLLAKIILMVVQAQRSRAPIQKLADIASGYFVPLVISFAIITALYWSFWSNQHGFAVVNAVAVLIIACPCALGLATPMSIMVGCGRGARAGILIKNAESLEIMKKINVIVLDKTGTLTMGKPQITSIELHKDIDEKQILLYAAAIEQKSEHPLANAIINSAKAKGLNFNDPNFAVKNFQSLTGQGVYATIAGKNIAIGNERLLESLNIKYNHFQQRANILRNKGHTVIYIALNNKLMGIIGISDPLKPTTKEAINQLKKLGLRIIMLTGDNENTANYVANQLNIDEIKANVMPRDKLEFIKNLQSQGFKVAMAGDGVNDSPALAQADIGIAMGTGTDIAMNSAEITLVKGDLRGIIRSRKLSIALIRNIKQNLILAFGYNIIAIPIAAGVLYPNFGILLSPIIASAAMVLSSICVILNAARLKNLKLV